LCRRHRNWIPSTVASPPNATRVDVVELHETAFVAPMPAYSDEGAPSEVA
jgi:hypothetical protein